MEETGTIVREHEEHLDVGCAGDITKTLSQLQHQTGGYVQSRIHVLSPTQSPTGKGAIYLGQLGLNGGMEQGEEKDDTSTLPSIYQVTQKGHLAVIQYLAEVTKTDANARDNRRKTALH